MQDRWRASLIVALIHADGLRVGQDTRKREPCALATCQNRELQTGMKDEKRSILRRGLCLKRETARRKIRCDQQGYIWTRCVLVKESIAKDFSLVAEAAPVQQALKGQLLSGCAPENARARAFYLLARAPQSRPLGVRVGAHPHSPLSNPPLLKQTKLKCLALDLILIIQFVTY